LALVPQLAQPINYIYSSFRKTQRLQG